MKEHTADILILYESAIINHSSFLAPKELAKKSSFIADRKLTTRFPNSSELIDEADELCTLPLTAPKGGSKSEFVVFVNKFKVNRIKFATKFLCVKTVSGSVVAELFPYLTV